MLDFALLVRCCYGVIIEYYKIIAAYEIVILCIGYVVMLSFPCALVSRCPYE